MATLVVKRINCWILALFASVGTDELAASFADQLYTNAYNYCLSSEWGSYPSNVRSAAQKAIYCACMADSFSKSAARNESGEIAGKKASLRCDADYQALEAERLQLENQLRRSQRR